MSRDELKRWRCQDCNTISLQPALLTAPNPFDPADTVTGCPHCRSVAQFDEICDEPGCEREAHCGFPAGPEFGGYRRTCSEHSEWGQARIRAAAALSSQEPQ